MERSRLQLAQKNHAATLGVQVAASICAVAMVCLAHGRVSSWYLYWLGAVLMVAAIRAAINPALRKRLAAAKPGMDDEARLHRALHCAGLIVSGGLWAFFAWSRLGV